MEKVMCHKKDVNRCLSNSIFALVIFVLLLSIAFYGCEKKETEPAQSSNLEKISGKEIEVKYPGYQKQMEKLRGYDENIRNLDSKDDLLKDMLLDASFNCIVEHLENVSKTDKGALSKNAKQLNEYLQKIHSLPYDKSFKFIQAASQKNDIDLLCVCLSTVGSETAQSETARMLGAKKDPKAVRSLVSRLSAIAFFLTGGTEGKIIRRETRAAFVEAISECTGLEFPDYDPDSEEGTLVVIKRTEKWLKENNL